MLTKRFLTVLLLLASSCRPASQPAARTLEITDHEFQRLALEMSESPGFFDTDNLISNESSYLHVIPRLKAVTRAGGAYLGVGPDQNFSYIAAVRPAIGFMVDVRRDNQLQHLYFKALFEMSGNRWEYLASLLGKPVPTKAVNPAASGRQIVESLRELASDPDYFAAVFLESWQQLRSRFPDLILESDRGPIRQMANSFFREHLDLKFRSHGRPARSFYPTFGELITATDLEDHEHNYLASESAYTIVRQLQRQNRIIPLIGNLAGQEALSRVAAFLNGQQLKVSAFYLSNVEFYLFQSRSFRHFVRNLRTLPSDDQSVLIRSYFGYWRRAPPETAAGHAVTSLVQRLPSLLEVHSENPFLGYRELVFRHYER